MEDSTDYDSLDTSFDWLRFCSVKADVTEEKSGKGLEVVWWTETRSY